eukprot:301677_1
MSNISGPYVDDSRRSIFKQQSVSTFRRVHLTQWNIQNGYTKCCMDQFQLQPTYDETITEIKRAQAELFANATTQCLIYSETHPRKIMETDTQYQFWLMQNPTDLYFRDIASKSTTSGCCVLL